MNKGVVIAAAMMPALLAAEWKISGGDEFPAERISFAKVAGHSHRCRKAGVSEEKSDANLFEWAKRHDVAAYGVGSPWSAANAAVYRVNETKDRDRYYGGLKNDQMKEMMDVEGSEIKVPVHSRVVIQCTLKEFHETGDHYLYICDVDEVLGNEDEKALFAWNGYAKIAPADMAE